MSSVSGGYVIPTLSSSGGGVEECRPQHIMLTIFTFMLCSCASFFT